MVSAFTFIDKGLSYEERYSIIEKCLLHYRTINKMQLPADDFIVENTKATVRVPFTAVEYVQTDQPHRLALIATDRTVYFYGTLKEVEQIDKRLFRCHQSYLVNKMQMSFYDTEEKVIVLKSGKRVPISRRLV